MAEDEGVKEAFKFENKKVLGFQLNLCLLSNDSAIEHTLFTKKHTGKSA